MCFTINSALTDEAYNSYFDDVGEAIVYKAFLCLINDKNEFAILSKYSSYIYLPGVNYSKKIKPFTHKKYNKNTRYYKTSATEGIYVFLNTEEHKLPLLEPLFYGSYGLAACRAVHELCNTMYYKSSIKLNMQQDVSLSLHNCKFYCYLLLPLLVRKKYLKEAGNDFGYNYNVFTDDKTINYDFGSVATFDRVILLEETSKRLVSALSKKLGEQVSWFVG